MKNTRGDSGRRALRAFGGQCVAGALVLFAAGAQAPPGGRHRGVGEAGTVHATVDLEPHPQRGGERAGLDHAQLCFVVHHRP